MGSIWDAKVYINDQYKTTVRVKNSTSLSQIRNIIFPINKEQLLPQDNQYFFLNRANNILLNDEGFFAKDVWKNDENGYKIELATEEYTRPENKIVNLYVNDIKASAIKLKGNTKLGEIKRLGGININKDTLFFLTNDNTIIENTDNFIAKDIAIQKGLETKINLVSREYYLRIQIIDHLEVLSRTIGPINWLRQAEFFIKIKDFAGETIANAIIEDLCGKIGTEEKINDRLYINKFLKLLANKININNINNNIINSSFYDRDTNYNSRLNDLEENYD